MARPLEGPELAAYDHVPLALAARVRVAQVPWLPNRASGMTLGRTVLLRHDHDRTGTSPLLAHELEHVHQFHRLGAVRFVSTYVADYVRQLARLRSHRGAYRAIGLEVSARAAASRWTARARTPDAPRLVRP